MAFFSKQKKNGLNANTEGNEKQVIRPSESLGSVLSESVPAASLDIIRSNTRFQLPNDAEGNARYIVATLDVNDIGGLNKRCARNDPDKGQFIECINCGNIESYVSEEGIANQTFVIVPTKKTLASLSEFSFLAKAEQFSGFIPTYVIVDCNGNMEFETIDAKVEYDWFVKISESNRLVTDAVKELTNEEFESIEKDIIEDTNSEAMFKADNAKMEETTAQADSQMQENNIFDAVLASMENVVESMAEKYAEPSILENEAIYEEPDSIMCPVCSNTMVFGKPCPSCGFDLDGQEAVEEAPVEEKTMEVEAVEEESVKEVTQIDDIDVLNAVERLFHAGGLDLEISAQPFDMQFIKENNFEPIPEDRNDSWLDGYVTQMIKNANAELYQLHKSNLFATRNRYLNLITEECELIATAVDINDPANEYARCKQSIMDETAKKRKSIDVEITRKRLELQQLWDSEMQQIQESAAAAAKRNYLEKHAKSHEASLREIENSLNDEIDMEYSERLSELNEKRRNDAKKRHDLAVTQTLIVIGESYEELLKEEEERREQLLAEIQEYIDNHRKDEVARNAVLAEAQRQREEASRVTEEFTRKIDAITSEHTIAFDKLKQELNVAYSHNTTLENDFNERLDKENTKYKELKEQYHTLMDKYVDIDNQKSKEYENRLNTLRNDKEAAQEHLAHVDLIHNKYNKISIVVWVAIAIAAFAIGAVFGSRFLAGNASDGHYSISFTSPEVATETATEEMTTEESTENTAVSETNKKTSVKTK